MQKDIEVDIFTNSCYQISGLLFDELSSDTTNGAARKNALASVPQRKWESTSLVSYQSAGKLLIIDQISQDTDQDRAIKIANDLAVDGFNTTILFSGNNPHAPAP